MSSNNYMLPIAKKTWGLWRALALLISSIIFILLVLRYFLVCFSYVGIFVACCGQLSGFWWRYIALDVIDYVFILLSRHQGFVDYRSSCWFWVFLCLVFFLMLLCFYFLSGFSESFLYVSLNTLLVCSGEYADADTRGEESGEDMACVLLGTTRRIGSGNRESRVCSEAAYLLIWLAWPVFEQGFPIQVGG